MWYDDNGKELNTKGKYVKMKLKILDDFGISDQKGDIKKELLALSTEMEIDRRCETYINNIIARYESAM